ncbi:hypothetical protein R50073_15800 [Maricurvus nonylphenolicus]|uniref:LuxR C-terminal-related transcriptional regulator n=1 Tax=Maricurvus nonylphenolicus TaxID=1008307 RepID=UPI0036F1CBCD
MSYSTFMQSASIQPDSVSYSSYIIKRDITERLVAGLASNTRLTLLVAPAGSGKTLLAREILAQFSDKSCYIDAATFNCDTLEAKDIAHPSLADSTESLIVIDNADTLRGQPVWQQLKQIVKSSLSSHRFVLVSRYDLAEDFARQKAEGVVTEVGFKELAFSSQELSELVSVMQALKNYGANESAGFLDALLLKSHGWPAGVVIGLQAVMNGHSPKEFVDSFCGKDRDVVSYFRENVMGDIGEDCAELLLECSLGKQIDDRYIQHVMGRCDTTRIKELIATENAFVIECDRNRDSLSLHPLFREFLEYEFSFRDQARCQELKKKHQEISNQFTGNSSEVVYADFGGMVEKLTNRETQLVALISSGFTNREIGEKLFISEKTVKWHLHKIYAKMGVKNRTTAVAKARSCQMIS